MPHAAKAKSRSFCGLTVSGEILCRTQGLVSDRCVQAGEGHTGLLSFFVQPPEAPDLASALSE